MEKPFKILDHTADIAIQSRGKTLEDAFSNIALGMFSIISDVGSIKTKEKFNVVLKSDDIESLAVDWLNELLYLNQTKGLLFSNFDVKSVYDNSISALCFGEHIDKKRHVIKTEIKAATYHDIQINDKKIKSIKVVFDV